MDGKGVFAVNQANCILLSCRNFENFILFSTNFARFFTQKTEKRKFYNRSCHFILIQWSLIQIILKCQRNIWKFETLISERKFFVIFQKIRKKSWNYILNICFVIIYRFYFPIYIFYHAGNRNRKYFLWCII